MNPPRTGPLSWARNFVEERFVRISIAGAFISGNPTDKLFNDTDVQIAKRDFLQPQVMLAIDKTSATKMKSCANF
jgi:hypothetical protein